MPPKTTPVKKAAAGATPKKTTPKKSGDDVVELMGPMCISGNDWGDKYHFMKGKDDSKTSF